VPETAGPPVSILSNTLGVGGAERQRVHLANGLARRGYEVHLVLLQSGGIYLADVAAEVTVCYRPWWRPQWRRGAPAQYLISGSTNTELGHGYLWRHTPRASAGSRAWLVAVHNPPATPRTFTSQQAWAMRGADGVIALAEAQWRVLTAEQRLSHRPPILIPNGIELSGAGGSRTLADDRLSMLFAGRLVEHKGVQVVIEALTGIDDPRWRFDIFGDGPHRGALESMVPIGLRDRITFHGSVADPVRAAADANLLVLPSRFEAQPMVILEAMAAGLPVMAQAVTAVPEMLAGGAGILVAGGAVADWRAAIEQLLADPAALPVLAERGLQRVREYSMEAMIDRYDAALRSLL
jgi:glycosyltransferase involved in cell wall biosynthesis